MKNITISPFFFVVGVAAFFLGFLDKYLSMFLILFLHEAAHLIMILYKKIEIDAIRVEAFGVNIRLKTDIIKNPDKEIVMAAAGPLCNIILAFLGFAAAVYYGRMHPFLHFFIMANLSHGLFNLFPVFPLDGGRILKAQLSKKAGYLKSYQFVMKVTRVVAILMFLAGVYIFIITGFNFMVCLIGCFLFFNLLTEKNQAHFYLMKEIADYKKKNRALEKIPIIHLAVNKDISAKEVLKELSYNRYYIFNVIEDVRLIRQITEGELIEGLISQGTECRVKDLI